MSVPPEIRTERLRLRPWLPADRGPFAALNARPTGHGVLPGPAVPGRERRARLAHRGALRPARLRVVGGGNPRRRPVRRIHRTVRPGVRGALHAVRGDRLAPRRGALGPGVCHGGSARLSGVRIRDVADPRDRVVHGRGQRSLAPGHGEDWDDPPAHGRLRSSGVGGGTSPPAPRAVQKRAPSAGPLAGGTST